MGPSTNIISKKGGTVYTTAIKKNRKQSFVNDLIENKKLQLLDITENDFNASSELYACLPFPFLALSQTKYKSANNT